MLSKLSRDAYMSNHLFLNLQRQVNEVDLAICFPIGDNHAFDTPSGPRNIR